MQHFASPRPERRRMCKLPRSLFSSPRNFDAHPVSFGGVILRATPRKVHSSKTRRVCVSFTKRRPSVNRSPNAKSPQCGGCKWAFEISAPVVDVTPLSSNTGYNFSADGDGSGELRFSGRFVLLRRNSGNTQVDSLEIDQLYNNLTTRC